MVYNNKSGWVPQLACIFHEKCTAGNAKLAFLAACKVEPGPLLSNELFS